MAILDGRDLSTCRAFTGYLGDRTLCTSLAELDEAHRRLWIRLASVSRFSVALDRTAADRLIGALDAMDACAVPCEHHSGRRLLGTRPHQGPGPIPHSDRALSSPPHGRPMSVSLRLGDDAADRIDVTLTRPATVNLVNHLRRCRDAMTA